MPYFKNTNILSKVYCYSGVSCQVHEHVTPFVSPDNFISLTTKQLFLRFLCYSNNPYDVHFWFFILSPIPIHFLSLCLSLSRPSLSPLSRHGHFVLFVFPVIPLIPDGSLTSYHDVITPLSHSTHIYLNFAPPTFHPLQTWSSALFFKGI